MTTRTLADFLHRVLSEHLGGLANFHFQPVTIPLSQADRMVVSEKFRPRLRDEVGFAPRLTGGTLPGYVVQRPF